MRVFAQEPTVVRPSEPPAMRRSLACLGDDSLLEASLPADRFSHDFTNIPTHVGTGIRIQAKLTVGEPDDEYEREADRIADLVMATSEPRPHSEHRPTRQAVPPGHVQMNSVRAGDSAGIEAPPIVRDTLNSTGQPLDAATRSFFEPRFGYELGDVRVHVDAGAAQSAKSVSARAYTYGRDIVFGAGEFSPASASGKRLLAHELAHARQQESDVGRKIQREPQPAAPAPAPPPPTYAAATNFAGLIALLRTAEAKLKASGQDVNTRLKTLRGLFYGTTWSMDYINERSAMRNVGFAYFLYGDPAIRTAGNLKAFALGQFDKAAPDPAYVPADPTTILGASLVKALIDSAEVTNADNRKVDVGHLLIGMEARVPKGGQEKALLNDPRPAIFSSPTPMGGTGLELTTWVGDLGGGTSQVAQLRASGTKTSARHAFTVTTHDYGAEVNLEGDIAAFLAGLPASASDPYAITLNETAGVAGAIETYLSPSAAGADWKGRAKRFLGFYGATFDASGALTNRAAVVAIFADHIQKFAVHYKETRMKDELMKKLGSSPTSAQLAKLDSQVKAAGVEIPGAAKEVAELFADALAAAAKDPGRGLVPP